MSPIRRSKSAFVAWKRYYKSDSFFLPRFSTIYRPILGPSCISTARARLSSIIGDGVNLFEVRLKPGNLAPVCQFRSFRLCMTGRNIGLDLVRFRVSKAKGWFDESEAFINLGLVP